MGTNSFQARENMRQQNLKVPASASQPADVARGPGRSDSVGLPAPRPKRKQCSLYLDQDMMERVKRVARQRGVAIGAVIEACVKMSLNQLEG